MSRWAGPLVAALILGGVALILVLNIEPTRPSTGNPSGTSAELNAHEAASAEPAPAGGFREYPIGEEYVDEGRHLRVAAVWLPSVQWDGQQAVAGTDVIHLEADVKATQNNPNGFSKDEFIPYLKLTYTIEPRGGGPDLKGDLIPMVAKDGLHYGASVAMPKSGTFRLTYAVEPPSGGGLGRHSDPASGVAAWWPPFTAAYEWDFEPPSAAPATPAP